MFRVPARGVRPRPPNTRSYGVVHVELDISCVGHQSVFSCPTRSYGVYMLNSRPRRLAHRIAHLGAALPPACVEAGAGQSFAASP